MTKSIDAAVEIPPQVSLHEDLYWIRQQLTDPLQLLYIWIHHPWATLFLALPSQWLTTEAALFSGQSVHLPGICPGLLWKWGLPQPILLPCSFTPSPSLPLQKYLLPKSLVTWCLGIHVLITNQLSCSERKIFLPFFSENGKPWTSVKQGDDTLTLSKSNMNRICSPRVWPIRDYLSNSRGHGAGVKWW